MYSFLFKALKFFNKFLSFFWMRNTRFEIRLTYTFTSVGNLAPGTSLSPSSEIYEGRGAREQGSYFRCEAF